MKKGYINSVNIVNVVELTADLFRQMNKEITYSPNKGEKASEMHFVADLLKDLVDTAYPAKENSPVENIVTEKTYMDFMKSIGVPEYLIPGYEEWKIIIVQGEK